MSRNLIKWMWKYVTGVYSALITHGYTESVQTSSCYSVLWNSNSYHIYLTNLVEITVFLMKK